MMENKLSKCPICGKYPKLHSLESPFENYKFICGLHVSCGDWKTTEAKATEDWNRRCTGYGQPEFYHSTMAEEFKRLVVAASVGELEKQLTTGFSGFLTEIGAKPSFLTLNGRMSDRTIIHPDCRSCEQYGAEYCICEVRLKNLL